MKWEPVPDKYKIYGRCLVWLVGEKTHSDAVWGREGWAYAQSGTRSDGFNDEDILRAEEQHDMDRRSGRVTHIMRGPLSPDALPDQ